MNPKALALPSLGRAPGSGAPILAATKKVKALVSSSSGSKALPVPVKLDLFANLTEHDHFNKEE